jgi:hypothetical protein
MNARLINSRFDLRRAAASAALTIALAACNGDSLEPDPAALVGAFGSALEPAQLLATMVGAQLDLGCGGYFVTREPIRIDAAGMFSVRGKARPDGGFYIGSARDAVLTGMYDAAARSVDASMHVEGSGPQVPVHYVLREGARFEGNLICPL